MGEAGEDCSPGRSFSLMCLEDGADLDAAGESAVDDAQLLLLYGGAGVVEEEGEKEEYMGHLVSKESSFLCGSPSAAAFSSDDLSAAAAEASHASCEASSSEEDWFCCARRDTVKWILETRASFGFSHRTAYLAVSYLDRFCLRRRFHVTNYSISTIHPVAVDRLTDLTRRRRWMCVQRSAMPWAARLQAVACVSLAAKMEQDRAPPLSAFRADDGYDFSSANIRKMELLVLSTLGWRMGDVTPLDYLPCLASRLRHRRRDDNSGGGGGGGGGALVAAKAAALIFSAAEAVSVLDYRPSTVAVAAVLAATHGAGATTKEALESEMSGLSPSWLLDKEDVHACYRLMLSEISSAAAPSNKRPPSSPSSGSMDVDAAAASGSKRARLELPVTGQ
ncbi:hypothetical protein U9M48_009935 [Paspalum notatum var. saurae]|uniref:Cyclin N-terminal domain-containing protein n=1 Tax=Paspalum notatum var. saurae TaxID=547442 RepID=A0AAQ3SSA6_PASNO